MKVSVILAHPDKNSFKNCIFGLCGVKGFYRKMSGAVVTSTLQEREKWLEEIRETVNRYFPEAEGGWNN